MTTLGHERGEELLGVPVSPSLICRIAASFNNRKGLYEFALGDQAADLGRLEALNQESRRANQVRTELEQALRIVAAPYTHEEFAALQPDPNIQAQLDAARQEVTATERNEQIRARDGLVRIGLPALNLDEMFSVLRRMLLDMNEIAMRQVREHFQKHPGRGIERWVAEGLQFSPDPECPFCGQGTEHSALMRAFNSYYSDAFRELNSAVAAAARVAREHLSIASVTNLQTMITTNEARRQVWLDLVPSDEIPFALAATVEEGRELHRLIERLFEAKVMSLPDPIVSPAEETRARELQGSILARISAYNLRVNHLLARYADRKREIAEGDLGALRTRVRQLEAVERRAGPEAITLIEQYQAAVTAGDEAASAKTALKTQLDARMDALLGEYQGAINTRLEQLHARFRIVQLEGTHGAGQAPRAGYRLQLRGREVAALGMEVDRPSFANVLSDADRRTLALAFFLARLDMDPHLADKVVVFDDPMTSFDAERRRTTVAVIRALSQTCAQVIVLSHDAHFLHDVHEAIGGAGHVCAVHRIGFHGHDVAFSTIDLAVECQNPHLRRYKLVADFLHGPPPHDLEKVASALRIFVEGFYKLRFPNDVHHSANLGVIRAAIAAAQPGTPLGRLAHLLEPLARFDNFTSHDHHFDPNDAGTVQLQEELRRYAFAAMSLIHDDGQSHPVPQ